MTLEKGQIYELDGGERNTEFNNGTGRITSHGINVLPSTLEAEGSDERPVRGSSVTMIIEASSGTENIIFRADRGSRLGFLISEEVYDESDWEIIASQATYATEYNTIEGRFESFEFVFNKTSDAQNLYLVWDLMDANYIIPFSGSDRFNADGRGIFDAIIDLGVNEGHTRNLFLSRSDFPDGTLVAPASPVRVQVFYGGEIVIDTFYVVGVCFGFYM